MYTQKNQIQENCANSCGTFITTFSLGARASVVDWMNNKAGRLYGLMNSYSEFTCHDAFLDAVNAGVVMLAEFQNVTGIQTHQVWETNDWYTGTSTASRTPTYVYIAVDDTTHQKVCSGCNIVYLAGLEYNYRYVDAGLYYHDRICRICSYTESEAHTVVESQGEKRCTSCGRTGIFGNIMQMILNGEITPEEAARMGIDCGALFDQDSGLLIDPLTQQLLFESEGSQSGS
ncbi:MAG: hypothetical protein ACI4U2_06480 [Christensenellaceae bacterium]